MTNEDLLFKYLLERITTLEKEVFSNPPRDFESFKELLGRYREAQELLQELHKVMKGIEDE